MKHFKRNLIKTEVEAIRKLKNNPNMIIKIAYKGSVIVITNKIHYIEEKKRQLQNRDLYEILQEDSTTHFNLFIHLTIKHGKNCNTLKENILKVMHNKHPTFQYFTCYIKYTNQMTKEDHL